MAGSPQGVPLLCPWCSPFAAATPPQPRRHAAAHIACAWQASETVVLHYGGREPVHCREAGIECVDILKALRFIFGAGGTGQYHTDTLWSWSASFISDIFAIAYCHDAPQDCKDVAFFLFALVRRLAINHYKLV